MGDWEKEETRFAFAVCTPAGPRAAGSAGVQRRGAKEKGQPCAKQNRECKGETGVEKQHGRAKQDPECKTKPDCKTKT